MTPKTDSRNVALIGAGYWGRNLARNLQALGALRVICDAGPNVLEAYGTEYPEVIRTTEVREVLADPAVLRVAIAAPAALHFELARAALAADKDVFVEKPLCLKVAEAEELVSMANRRGRILMVGHLLQYHPCIERLRSMTALGELGRLQYITSNRLNLGKIRREENALWSFAPHDLSVILALAGGQLPDRVICVGEAYLNQQVCDTTLTALRFGGGLHAHVYVSWLNPFKEQKLTVVGSHGMAVFDDTRPWAEKLTVFRHYLTWTDGQTPVPNRAQAELVPVPEAEPLREECRHFLQACDDRKPPRTDGAEGLRVLQVLRAAQESLEHEGVAVVPGRIASASASAPASVPEPAYQAHPTAVIDAGAEIGAGTRIWHFAHISAGSRIGERCVFGQNTFVAPGVVVGNRVKVQNNVALYQGVVVEDEVFLGPSCVLTNVTNPRSQVDRHQCYEKTWIRRGTTVGANATVVCGVTLGQYSFIAAGAVVTRDVPDYALMVGVPARQAGWMSRHGHPLKPGPDGTLRCPESGFRYREVEPGVLRCLDVAEDAPLAKEFAVGSSNYREFQRKAAERG
jgi:UDP-2-acetamido-3-amino-2,3-dideoxy-glucuronate N-acetyltransferase